MPALTNDEINEFLVQVEADSRPRPSFYGLIFLASTIATFGLLSNSAAVIIGAMLVAPLMSAIIAVSVSVVLNRRSLMRRATIAMVTGAALAIGTGFVLSFVSPLTETGGEILGRVRPTLYDLWIAAAAGIAGAFSLLRARSSAALPGVAIATALVPPLVTAGIELRLLNFGEALGALLLFVSNMVAITCAGMAVFVFYGLQRSAKYEADYKPSRVYGRWGASFLAIGLLLAHSLQQVVWEVRTNRDVDEILRSQVRMIPGASVDRFELTDERDALAIRAVVATPNSVGPPLVATTQRLLSSRLKRPVRLVIRSVLTKDANALTYLLEEKPASRVINPLEVVDKVLREQASALPDAELINFTILREGLGYQVSARFRVSAPVDPVLIRGIRNLLADELSAPVELRCEAVPLPLPGPPLAPEDPVALPTPPKLAAPNPPQPDGTQ